MADVLGQVNAAASLTKTLLSLPAIAASAEAKVMIADLQMQLADVKSQLADLMNENRTLKAKIETLSSPAPVKIQEGKYYALDGDGPFCTGCFDGQHKLMRLVKMADAFHMMGKWRCPECTTKYQ